MFTHGGHLQYGVLPHPSSSQKLIFYAKLGKCGRTPDSPLIEAERAAMLIAQDARAADKQLELCMSGGVDSECMAISFQRAGVPFEAFILRFSDGLNDYDIRHAVTFCERNAVPYRWVDLDVLRFFDEGTYLEYARRFRCSSPQLVTHIYLMEQMDGYPVMAWNCPNLESTALGELSIGLPGDKYFSYFRYLEESNRVGCPFFFLYTPELTYSFLRLPILRKLIEEKVRRPITYAMKCAIYREAGFEVDPKESKFTGFEKIKEHYARLEGGDLTTFDRLFRAPLEALFPAASHEVSIFSKNFI